MATESVRIRYRPLRLGWCVREGNWDDLRSVIRSAHALWGGVFNPILSIGDVDQAAQLVRLYEVDALFQAGDDLQLRTFVDRFPHLRWPSVHRTLFIQGSRGKGHATFLDVYHPARGIYEEHIHGKPEPKVTATLYEWVAALTLQQMDTVLSWGMLFVTSTTIESATGAFGPCETDLVIISSKGFYDERLGIAIGECKGKCEITEEDVRNLTQVADAFPNGRIAPFIIFSKTAPFTTDEIARCRAAQPAGRRRLILLSDRELEPYFVYEGAAKEFVIDSTAISLEDLANTTHSLYFDPKPRPQP